MRLRVGVLVISLMPLLMGQAATRPSAATKPVDFYALSAEEFFKRADVKARVGKDSVDIALLEAAIFQRANQQRVLNKLPLFKHGSAMQLMARSHCKEMAALQYFEHTSPTPANRTLTDRLKNVGLVNVTAGENIAVLPAKEMGSGRYIIRKGAEGTEVWIDEATGKTVEYYTYEQLSAAVMDQWMNSPPHRQNLLDARFVYLGAGAARGPYAEKGQDSFYMTQNFCSTMTPASETRAAGQLVAGK